MTSRDQFEQAYAEDNGMTLLQVVEQRMASGSYRVPAMSRAWFWWQESRAVATNAQKELAQRLREYNHNPHHIDPVSQAFHALIDEAVDALSSGVSVTDVSEEALNVAYWDFDARCKGYAPYRAPCGNQVRAFKTAIYAAIEAAGLKVAS